VQRHGKHTSTALELLLETVFSARSVQRSYLEDSLGYPDSCQLEMSSAKEAEKTGPERVKLKNSQGTAGERLSGCCGDL
jgi:hypothetical protein